MRGAELVDLFRYLPQDRQQKFNSDLPTVEFYRTKSRAFRALFDRTFVNLWWTDEMRGGGSHPKSRLRE